MKTLIEKSNGRKTESVGILMVAFQILMLYKPDLINPTTERTVNIIISSGIVTTIIHRIVRNRKKIWSYIKTKIKSFKQH